MKEKLNLQLSVCLFNIVIYKEILQFSALQVVVLYSSENSVQCSRGDAGYSRGGDTGNSSAAATARLQVLVQRQQ